MPAWNRNVESSDAILTFSNFGIIRLPEQTYMHEAHLLISSSQTFVLEKIHTVDIIRYKRRMTQQVRGLAGSHVKPLPYCTSTHCVLTAPHAGLSPHAIAIVWGDNEPSRILPAKDKPRGLLLLLLGASQRKRHGHRAGWLWLALRNALGCWRTPVSRLACYSRCCFDGRAA